MQRLQVLQLIITHHLRGRTADWIETYIFDTVCRLILQFPETLKVRPPSK